MKSAETEFVGGPLDGKVLPVLLDLFHNVPRIYRVPVPAHGDNPAATLVYRRARHRPATGRPRWRYEYAPEGVTPEDRRRRFSLPGSD